jgi:hypothetical protein
VLAVQPVRGDLALVVELAQLEVARSSGSGDRSEQHGPLLLEARVGPVELDQRVAQVGEVALEAHQERRVAVEVRQRPLEVGAHLGAHRVPVLHGDGRLDDHLAPGEPRLALLDEGARGLAMVLGGARVQVV